MTKISNLFFVPPLVLFAFFFIALVPSAHAITYSLKEIQESSGASLCGNDTAGAAGTTLSFTGDPDGVDPSTYPSGFLNAPDLYCYQVTWKSVCLQGYTTYNGGYDCTEPDLVDIRTWYQYTHAYTSIQGSDTNIYSGNSSFAVVKPTASLTASSTTIYTGQSTRITWNSTFALSCTGTNFSTGSGKAISGQVTISPTAQTTYTVTCTNDIGSATASVTVNVKPPVTFSVSPGNIFTGDSAQISWGFPGAALNGYKATCTGTGFSTGGAISGTISVSPTTAQIYTYSVSCTDIKGYGGSKSDTLVVKQPVGPAPTVSLTATPSSIIAPNFSTLAWSSTNATSCTGSGFNTANAISGSVSVAPSSTTSYSVTCTGSGGNGFASVSVVVTGATDNNTNTGPNSSCTLNASPTTLSLGDSVQFTWSCQSGISTCSAINNAFYTGGASDNNGHPRVTATPNQTGTVSYGISCTGNNASATAYVSVLVETPNVTINAAPTRVLQGALSTLTWSGTDITSCTVTDSSGFTLAQGNADGSGNFSRSSPFSAHPTSQTTYTITCQTGGNPSTATSFVTVNVTPIFTPF